MKDIIALDWTIGGEIAIDKTIEIDKIIEGMTQDKETGVKVGTDQGITAITVLEVEMEIETETDGCNPDPELCQMREEDHGLGLTQRASTNRDRLRCYRCGEYDHFAQECPNTPMDNEMGHSDSEQASLQMLTRGSLPPNSNGEVKCLNL